ncbi:hypothetical protein GCM10010275_56120 [Streptomyces litmocidini]|nr:hypothetical protein GCM10010275_56120 [Streptomyces litmocidini]
MLPRLFAGAALPADDRRDLLRTAVARRPRLSADVLRTYADDAPASDAEAVRAGHPPAPELVDAMGLSGDLSFAPRLGALLSDPNTPRGRTARAPVVVGVPSSTPRHGSGSPSTGARAGSGPPSTRRRPVPPGRAGTGRRRSTVSRCTGSARPAARASRA